MPNRKIFKGGEFLITEIKPEEVFTPEDLTRENRMVYKAADDFVKKEIYPNIEKIEEKDEKYIRSLLEKAGELGLNGTDVPEEYGGEEMDKISTGLVTEAMGAAASFAVSFAAHTGIGTLPLVFFGNEAQKKKYLPKLVSGEWFASYCLTESGAGSDALNITTEAKLSDDGKHYVINGEKIFITNGAWADVYILYAKIDGEKFTGFIVERGYPGLSIGSEEKKMGIKGSSTVSVILKDCKVPVENVLYKPGEGHKIAFNILNIGRFKLGASVIGACKLAITEALKYATSREQFGKKISEFGMIQSKLSEMCVKTYFAEALSNRIAAMIDDRLGTLDEKAKKDGSENAKAIEEYAVECSIAKVYGSECIDFCADELVQIFGGNGYISEFPADRMYRDSRINRIFEGTNEINRLLITGTLLKRGMQGRLGLMAAIQAVSGEIKNMMQKSPGKAAAQDNDIVLNNEEKLLIICKKVFLMCAGSAANKLKEKLENEQEVLAFLSDIIIEIFVMESGLLRAIKLVEKKDEKTAEYHIAAVKLYFADTLVKVKHWARQVLAFVEEGDTLEKQCYIIEKLLYYKPFNTIALKRLIAGKAIKRKKYIYNP